MKRTLTVIAIAVACVLGFVTGAAAAAGPWGYYGPHHGKDYRNRAIVDGYGTDPRVRARTEVEVLAGETAAVGFIGARPRLFKDDSLCYQSSDFFYNDSRTTQWIVIALADCGSGTYLSWGVTKAYNYNGEYSSYYTVKSPVIND